MRSTFLDGHLQHERRAGRSSVARGGLPPHLLLHLAPYLSLYLLLCLLLYLLLRLLLHTEAYRATYQPASAIV